MTSFSVDGNTVKEYFKRWPRFYYFIFDFFGPVYFGGLGAKAFLKKYPTVGIRLNVGAGARRIAPGVTNVDICKYESVDVVAEITSLPFQDSSVDQIICDQVLEHVRNPQAAVDELRRVLKSGGYAYISVPFMYPFHASPSDFQRFTHEGLRELFRSCTLVELGVRCGPFSTLTTYLCYLFATLFSFGSERVYWVLVYASTFVFFPLKVLDVFANRLPHAIHMASVLYCVIRKP